MHITQAHRPHLRIDASPRSCLEAAIYHRLRLLDPEARRTLVSHRFSQAQRLALEQWILSNERAPPAAKSHRRSSGRNAAAVLAKGRAARRRSSSSRPLLPGVACRKVAGQLRYAASGSAGPFRLHTRFVTDPEVAQRFRTVLESIRRQINTTGARNDDEGSVLTSHAFVRAVSEQPARHGLDAILDMGLSFTVTVAAGYWVGRQLLTPRFAVGSLTGLQAGLQACRRLRNARGLIYAGFSNRYSILRKHSPQQLQLTWERLKEEYLNVWVEAGKNRAKVEAQLSVMEDRHRAHRHRLAARWARLRMGPSSPRLGTFARGDCSPKNANERNTGTYSSSATCSGAVSKAVRQIEALLACWVKQQSRKGAKAHNVVVSQKRRRDRYEDVQPSYLVQGHQKLHVMSLGLESRSKLMKRPAGVTMLGGS